MSTNTSIHNRDLHVWLCTKKLFDETIFWQAVFFRVEVSVSAIAKNHKNTVLTLLGGRDVSDGFRVLQFPKLQIHLKHLDPPKSVKTIFLWFLAIAETLSSTLKKTACQKIVSSLRFSRHNLTCKSLSWILVLVDTNSVYTPNYMTSAKYRGTEVHFYLFGTTTRLGGLFDGARMKQG